MSKLKNYELTIIIDPSVGDVASTEAEVEASLKKRQAEVVQKDDWGKRRLFHPPKHINEAQFKYYKLTSAPESIALINTDLKVNAGVMKSILVSI